MAQQNQSEIRYLTPPSVDVKKKKYCRFKKNGIKYIDYKDPEFLKKILERTRKNPSPPHHGHFVEISTQSSSGCKKSPPFGFAPLCNRHDEII